MTYDLTLEPNLSLGPIFEIYGISINFKPNRTNSDNFFFHFATVLTQDHELLFMNKPKQIHFTLSLSPQARPVVLSLSSSRPIVHKPAPIFTDERKGGANGADRHPF